jgi:competence protein ComEA
MIRTWMVVGACVAVMSAALGEAALGAAQAAREAAPAAGAAAPASAVNLNTASLADLEKLPGIGPATAQRIVEYRQKNGGFKKIEDLMNVRGIGEASFLKLKPQITVAPVRTAER